MRPASERRSYLRVIPHYHYISNKGSLKKLSSGLDKIRYKGIKTSMAAVSSNMSEEEEEDLAVLIYKSSKTAHKPERRRRLPKRSNR